MNETLQKIRQETLERLKAAKDESEIESLSVSVFGKSGSLTEILKSMGKLSKEERASVGQSVNAVKKELEKELNERKAEIAARMQELRFEREAIDGRMAFYFLRHYLHIVLLLFRLLYRHRLRLQFFRHLVYYIVFLLN